MSWIIWGDTENQRRVHLVAWDDICQPKNKGGLGLRKMKDINATAMMK